MRGQFLRVLARLKDRKSNPSGRHGNECLFDVVVDEDGVILKNFVFFGIYGTRGKGEENYPFALYSDGAMDFANEWNENERYFRTNIREKALSSGEYFTIEEFDGDMNYEIYKLMSISDFSASK